MTAVALFTGLTTAIAENPVVHQESDYFCHKIDKPIKLNGDLNQWRDAGALPLFLSGAKHVVMPDWRGPGDVGVTVWMLHDDRNLYFAALVHDQSPCWQEKAAALYRGSGFQLAFDPLDDTLVPGYDGNDIEFGFGRLADGSAVAHAWVGGEALAVGALNSVQVKVTDISSTDFFYEAVIPWSTIKPFKPAGNAKFGFNVLYNASKNQQRRGWLHWTPGIGEEKLAFMFRNVRLCGKNEGNGEALITTDRQQYSSGDTARIAVYLPTDKAGEGNAEISIVDNGKTIHQEKQSFKSLRGGTELNFVYETARLRGNGLEVKVTTAYPGGENTLEAEILNLSASRLQEEAVRLGERSRLLRQKLETAKAASIPVDYPLVSLAICDATLRHRNFDLSKPERIQKFALLPKIYRQFRQLNAMLERAEKELDGLQSGMLPRKAVPVVAMRDISIRNGAFYAGGEPVILIGPHGWWQVYPDIDLIAEAGFNLIGGTLIAGDATPAPGKKRTDYGNSILKHMRTMQKYNIAYDFLISPHPLPKGWTEAHPEMKDYNASGWIGSSLYIDATRKMVDAMWEVLIPMVRNEPNLASLNLVNEWSFSDGLTHLHPEMLARFIGAMKVKYGTIEALNKQWRSSYASFEAIEPLKFKKNTPGAFYDWESFRYREGLENVRFLHDTARKYDAKTPLQIKTIAVTDLNPEQYTPVGVEREERGEIMDIAGSDCASTIHLDYYRSMIPGKPASDTEFHVSVSTSPAEIVTDCWSAILHGEGMRQYFAWSNSYSAENLAAGAVLHIPESMEALGRATLDIRRLVPEILLFQQAIPQAEVGILYSPASKYCDPAYPPMLRQCHALLSNLDTQVRFISERQLAAGKFSNLKMIIIPGANYLEPETISALNKFTAQGGRLLHTPGFEVKDPYGNKLAALEQAAAVKLDLASLDQALVSVKRPVRLRDPSGKILTGSVELRTVDNGNEILFYIINYGAPVKVQPELNGQKITRAEELTGPGEAVFPLDVPSRKPLIFKVKK